PPIPGGCFRQCQSFVFENHGQHATYFEGFYGYQGGAITPHGWLVVNGTVFDPTHEANAPLFRENNLSVPTPAYFGIGFPFGDEFLSDYIARHNKAGGAQAFMLLPQITP